VSYGWYETAASQVKHLRQAITTLIAREATPGSITVLSPRRLEDCCASRIAELSLDPVTEENVVAVVSGKHHRTTYSTVSSFKGLENDFIVITDIDELEPEWWRSVVYVGMSRARIALHLLLNQKLKSVYQERLRQWMELSGAPAAE
jgi:hypothetical protein